MRVLIVDDEPKAIELIASYISHFADFKLVKTFRNGLKALEFLNTNEIDIIFLDINMPHLSGLSLSKMISPKTAIVFTTAYSEHAVESYNVNAFDYLLKPISLERFSKTVTKLLDVFETKQKWNSTSTENAKTIFVKSGLETHQIQVDAIDYLKKDGNYMYYFVGPKNIMVRESIAEAVQNLTNDFIQVQKSYIVNFKKINSITADYISIGDFQIPIGEQFKKVLRAKMKN